MRNNTKYVELETLKTKLRDFYKANIQNNLFEIDELLGQDVKDSFLRRIAEIETEQKELIQLNTK